MTIWAAIPVKPVSEGKSRLAGAITPQARVRLNTILFHRTLDAVASVIPVKNIIIVSRDGALRDAARLLGMVTIAELGFTLNEALSAAAILPERGDALLAISTDLPDLTPEDVRAMLPSVDTPGVDTPSVDMAGPYVSIAPDRDKRGTNALFTAPAGCIPFHFGENSFAAHRQAALAGKIQPRIIVRPGLAFDLDLPEDLPLCPPNWFS